MPLIPKVKRQADKGQDSLVSILSFSLPRAKEALISKKKKKSAYKFCRVLRKVRELHS